jgi:hypothetical protein
MTLADYLRQLPGETDPFPRSDWTVPLLWTLVQGGSITHAGAATRDALLGCQRLLRELRDTTTDRELRADVEFHLQVVTIALERTVRGDAERRPTPARRG